MRKIHKVKKRIVYRIWNLKNIAFVIFTFIFIIFTVYYFFLKAGMANFNPLATETVPATTTLHLLFTGDIFLDRGIDQLSQKSELKYAYPFQGLNTLERKNYDAWIGNLECPVTVAQSTKREKSVDLRFSCKKEYLSELAKYFNIVSLANNHTDNMSGEKGLIETRKHLDEVGIKYFGHYDNSVSKGVCKVINIENKIETKNLRNPQISVIPVAFCGFHGVFKLPTDKELAEIKEFSKNYFTIVMPHQGEEYKFTNNTYQKLIYRKMIDNGADVVIGAHPHVVQNVETYKGKKIFYSLGNFIFDQSWSKTREHMVVDMELTVTNSTTTKARYSVKYKPIFTYSNLDFVTKKQNLTEQEYQKKLKQIGF